MGGERERSKRMIFIYFFLPLTQYSSRKKIPLSVNVVPAASSLLSLLKNNLFSSRFSSSRKRVFKQRVKGINVRNIKIKSRDFPGSRRFLRIRHELRWQRRSGAKN